MEDVLDLYAQPYDPSAPVVLLDEKLVTLHADKHLPQAVTSHHPERVDYEYVRLGTANLFVTVEPLAGWRHTAVTDQRTNQDFARHLRWLADEQYPAARVIRLVMDNLNIHALATLYLVYPPAEARRLLQRFEVHHTPKHASWLNMAEIAIDLIEYECLRRRVPDRATLVRRLAALEQDRNTRHATITWRFRSADARIKMQRVYPKLATLDLSTSHPI